MKFDGLPGNDALKRQLSAQCRGRGLSHAYLISGPEGSGKAALARILASAMVCVGSGEKPCGQCPACKKVSAGIHPDVIHIDIPEGKREILVEQTRKMRSDAWIRPNEGARKVYIIHNAQTMNPSAQNSILKLLEEGPPYAAFLLLADNPGALLPTIRSRCEEAALTPASAQTPSEGPGRALALELLELLAGEDELALCAWSVSLEKQTRETVTALLEEEIALLRDALAPQAMETLPAPVRSAARLPRRKLLDAAALMEKLRRDAGVNVSPGHLAGALCAGLFSL